MWWKSYADLSQLASDHKPVPDPGSHFPQFNLVNQGLKKKERRKNRQHYFSESWKTHLNASSILTPGLKYCTAQRLNSLRLRFCRSCPAYLAGAVQMQWLVSTIVSAFALQQSSWTNRKSSLSLLIGGTISIIRGLSVGEGKRLQMSCNYCTFFSPAFDLLAPPPRPLNSPLECYSEIWQPSRQPYAAEHGVFTSRSVWRPTWLKWLPQHSINYYITIRQGQQSDADK